MEECTDEQLAVLAAKQDEAALEELVSRYLKPVYYFVRTYVSHDAVAEDVVQEVFVKVWKHLGTYDQGLAFRPWLYTIAKRTALDYLKKKQLVSFSELENEHGQEWLSQTVVDVSSAPDVLANSTFEQQRVQHALTELSPKYAEVVSLYHTDELNFREIAENLNEPLNTVKSRYRRALLILKGLLRD